MVRVSQPQLRQQRGRSLIYLRDVAEMLGVHADTVLDWSAKGQFPPGFKLGKRWAWEAAEVEQYLANLTSGEGDTNAQ
jgi:predicted DNA-binding transcriptional regulator AlpA